MFPAPPLTIPIVGPGPIIPCPPIDPIPPIPPPPPPPPPPLVDIASCCRLSRSFSYKIKKKNLSQT